MIKINYQLYLFVLSFLFFQIQIHSQSKEDPFKEIIGSKLSNTEKEKKIEILLNQYIEKNDSITYGYDLPRYGIWLYKTNIKKAIIYGKKAVDFAKSIKPRNNFYYASNLNNLALYYYKSRNYLSSIKYYKKTLDTKESDISAANIYYKIGQCLKKIGDFHTAIEHFNKSASIFQKQEDNKNLIKVYLELASTHQRIFTFSNIKNGIKILHKADSISQITKTTIKQKFSINQRLGNLYNSHKGFDPKICLKYYKKALLIAIENDKQNWISTTYNNIGNIYHEISTDSALYFFKKAQLVRKDNTNSKARTLYNIGLSYLYENEFNNAINTLEKALDTLNILRDDKASFLKSVSKTADKKNLLYILKKNSIAHLKNSNTINSKAILEKALTYFDYTDLLVDHIRFESSGKQSKLFWREQASDLYPNAIKVCSLLDRPERAYYFMEKSKALLLLEDINNEQLKRMVNISDNTIEKEFLLKRKIAEFENLIVNAPNNSIDSLKILLFNQKEIYQRFIDSLQKDHPQYVGSKKTPNIFPLAQVQQYANTHNTVFLEYILQDELGFGLIITKGKTEIFEIKNIDKLKENITIFSNLISAPFSSKKDKKTYQTVSKYLYHQLIPNHIRPILTKKINIISDYSLHNIPFEALMNENNEYLIKDHEISYAYSVSFLLQNKNLLRSPKKEFLGFAPVQYTNNLSTLSNSKAEVDLVATGFDSTILLRDKASKQNLINQLSDYKLIHLSTHANANDSIMPWIASVNDKITLYDIYATKNNAELIVLSACNTSLGTIEKGEGVMSLARGFFNTGANSVVSTLWKADDQSTMELSTDFYKYLKKRKSKSEALRQAKLNYLKNHSLSKTSPYYWSSLILIGNPDPLSYNTSNTTWVFILGFLFVFSLIFFFYKKFRK